MGESSGRWGRAPLASMVPVNVDADKAGGLVVSGLGGAAGEERWRHFDSSVNAVSFGFVATAILIAMFVVMAIFERFLHSRRGPQPLSSSPERTWPRRPRRFGPSRSGSTLPESPDGRYPHRPQQGPFVGKLDSCPSPKMCVYAKEVSVLMPGEDVPTFIAHPAPAPCCPERIDWPSHQQISLSSCTSIPVRSPPLQGMHVRAV